MQTKTSRTMIKKIIAFVPCYVFYFIGDRISKALNKMSDSADTEWLVNLMYNYYVGFMLYSSWWNDFGGLNLWGQPDKVV